MPRLGLLLSFSIAGLACSQPAPPESYLYDLKFPPGSVPDGAGLYQGDKLLDEVSAPPPLAGGPQQVGTASFRLPSRQLLSALEQPLTLRVSTPCGLTAPVAVTLALTRAAEEQHRVDAGENTPIRSDAAAAPVTWPASAELWVDRGSETQAEATVGVAKIYSLPMGGTKIYDLGCAPNHPITYQGKPVGSFTPPNPSPGEAANYLVVPDASLCYREHDVTFAPLGAPAPSFSRPDTILTGAPVHRLRERPTYFLTSAPGRSERDGQVYQLTRIPCE